SHRDGVVDVRRQIAVEPLLGRAQVRPHAATRMSSMTAGAVHLDEQLPALLERGRVSGIRILDRSRRILTGDLRAWNRPHGSERRGHGAARGLSGGARKGT